MMVVVAVRHNPKVVLSVLVVIETNAAFEAVCAGRVGRADVVVMENMRIAVFQFIDLFKFHAQNPELGFKVMCLLGYDVLMSLKYDAVGVGETDRLLNNKLRPSENPRVPNPVICEMMRPAERTSTEMGVSR